MFCSKCGSQIAEDSAFCPKCGVRLHKEDAESANTVTAISTDASAADTAKYDVVLDGELKELLSMEEQEQLAASAANYDVVLMEIGANKMMLIKAVRSLTGLGLAETKDLVENTPGVVMENISMADAYDIKAQLEKFGAEVLVQGGNAAENMNLSFEEILPEFNEFGKSKTLGDYEKGKLKEVLSKVNNVFKQVKLTMDVAADIESKIEVINSKIASISGIFSVSKYLVESEETKFLTAEIAPLNDKLRKTVSKRRWIKFLLVILGFALGAPTVGFSLLICLVLFVVFLVPTKSIKAQSAILNNAVREYLESKIPPLETELNKYTDIINDFGEKAQLPPFSLIPPDYRDSAVLDAMIHYLENMEASTWQECVAVWKNDKHREEILAQQEEIRRLTEQTAQNAAITAQNTAATARNSQISARNSAKIARNTNKIRKSARTANVISYFSYMKK
jgi:ribosomal protein L7/L12